MSDGYKRKHESGFEKRQKKKENEKALNKMKGSLFKFINTDNNCASENNDNSLTTSSVTTGLSIPEITMTETDAIKQSETNVTNEQVCPAITIQSDDSDPQDIGSKVENVNLKYSNESNDPAAWEITADLINYYANISLNRTWNLIFS